METCPIEKVAVLEDGRTAVFPELMKGMWQYVYREAAGVYWEPDLGCFVSTPPREWTPQKWYQQIVSVVRSGLGLEMFVSPETKYESRGEKFDESIKIADDEVRSFIRNAEQGGAGNGAPRRA